MIRIIQQGTYSLLETKKQTKILVLDNDTTFAWVDVEGIGEILVLSHKKHKADTKLSAGEYKLYTVKNEAEYVDLQHLELEIGNNVWQGYLLPTGLPNKDDRRNRIVPTEEVITR